MSNLKEQLGNDRPIPASYNVSYFVHEDDMNKLDQSHKRVERWLFGLGVLLLLTLVASNAYWYLRLF